MSPKQNRNKVFIFCLAVFTFFSSVLFSQTPQLWGIADALGSNPGSVLFKINADGTGYTGVYTISGLSGGSPSGSLIEAGDGLLYGMCEDGGANNFGVIFSYDPVSSVYTKLYDFAGANGGKPYGSLLQFDCENLYGMTQSGGAYGKGVVFSFNFLTHVYTKHFDFINSKGIFPAGNLMKAVNGLLYGMTNGGGANNYGVLFSFDPALNSYTKLIDFNGANGQAPFGSIIQADDGKLYGMTYYGGANNLGVLFSFDSNTNTHTKLVDFNNSKGTNPLGNLMQASNGLLYGMTSGGGNNNSGTLFSLTIFTNVFTKIFDFGSNGAQPNGSLIEASDGNLYATTEVGGTNLTGTIFSYKPTGNNFADIFNFSSASLGKNPSCDLTEYKPVVITLTCPNVFTPNADGINDTWYPIISEYDFKITDFQVSVYDRWGLKIYESTNEKNSWDGYTTSGIACSEGTYYYVVKYKALSTACKKKHKALKGFLQLAR